MNYIPSRKKFWIRHCLLCSVIKNKELDIIISLLHIKVHGRAHGGWEGYGV